jgi:hypothetical protein
LEELIRLIAETTIHNLLHLSSDRSVTAHSKPEVTSVNLHVNEVEKGHTRTDSYGNAKYCLMFFEKFLNYAYMTRFSYLSPFFLIYNFLLFLNIGDNFGFSFQ